MRGSTLIAAGLIVLLAASAWPTAPIITALALVAFGATQTTLARLRNNPHLLPLAFLHAATYAILYAIFIGATLHASSAATPSALPWHVVLDIVMSLVPMTMATKRISALLLQTASQSR